MVISCLRGKQLILKLVLFAVMRLNFMTHENIFPHSSEFTHSHSPSNKSKSKINVKKFKSDRKRSEF